MDKEFFQEFALVAAGLVVVIFFVFAVMEETGPGPFVVLLVVLGIAAAAGDSGKKGPGDGGGAEDYPFGSGD
jgi:hypothetical protein